MKRILLALILVGFLLPLAPRAESATEVSLNFFYDNLSAQGSWIEVADYGYCFQPNVGVSNSDWRPYADGYWAYTDLGWTWVSYEDFGWATYHYGRWTSLNDYGWVWVPGYEWSPAWVSWRTGGDYVGWAPLPPTRGAVYEGRAITGQVDVEFDIGPLYYNFVDVRYIGEPVLRSRIFAPTRNVTIINQTVNVTNITYNNSIVYNYGPDYNRLNQYSTRPIQRLVIQRETTVGANLGQGGKRGNFNRVSGNQLTVVAPAIQKSQQPIAPKQVKAKVEKPQFERGWQGVQNRQQLETEMKAENAKNIPPPSFQPQKDRKRVENAAPPQPGAPAEQQAADQPPKPAVGAEQAQDNDQKAERQKRRAEKAAAEGDQQERPSADGAKAEGQDQEAQRQNNRAKRAAGQRDPQERPAPNEPDNQAADRERADRDQSAGNRTPEDRAERRQKTRERRAQPAEESSQPEDTQKKEQAQPNSGEPQPKNNRSETDRNRRAERAEPAQDANDGNATRRQEKERSDSDRNRRAERPEPERARPADREPERARPAESEPERPRPADRGEAQGSRRPERAERPQPPREHEARSKQQQEESDQNPENQRKGKKKKPGDDQPPPQP